MSFKKKSNLKKKNQEKENTPIWEEVITNDDVDLMGLKAIWTDY